MASERGGVAAGGLALGGLAAGGLALGGLTAGGLALGGLTAGVAPSDGAIHILGFDPYTRLRMVPAIYLTRRRFLVGLDALLQTTLKNVQSASRGLGCYRN